MNKRNHYSQKNQFQASDRQVMETRFVCVTSAKQESATLRDSVFTLHNVA